VDVEAGRRKYPRTSDIEKTLRDVRKAKQTRREDVCDVSLEPEGRILHNGRKLHYCIISYIQDDSKKNS
jgi:hypothetical protein